MAPIPLRDGWLGLALGDVEAFPADIRFPTALITVLVVGDTRASDGRALVAFGEKLVALGAAYVCAWGPDASRLETCVDEAIVGDGSSPDPEFTIMTTAHEHESLEEALFFFAHCAIPEVPHAAEGWIRLVIALGDRSLLDRVGLAAI